MLFSTRQVQLSDFKIFSDDDEDGLDRDLASPVFKPTNPYLGDSPLNSLSTGQLDQNSPLRPTKRSASKASKQEKSERLSQPTGLLNSSPKSLGNDDPHTEPRNSRKSVAGQPSDTQNSSFSIQKEIERDETNELLVELEKEQSTRHQADDTHLDDQIPFTESLENRGLDDHNNVLNDSLEKLNLSPESSHNKSKKTNPGSKNESYRKRKSSTNPSSTRRLKASKSLPADISHSPQASKDDEENDQHKVNKNRRISDRVVRRARQTVDYSAFFSQDLLTDPFENPEPAIDPQQAEPQQPLRFSVPSILADFPELDGSIFNSPTPMQRTRPSSLTKKSLGNALSKPTSSLSKSSPARPSAAEENMIPTPESVARPIQDGKEVVQKQAVEEEDDTIEDIVVDHANSPQRGDTSAERANSQIEEVSIDRTSPPNKDDIDADFLQPEPNHGAGISDSETETELEISAEPQAPPNPTPNKAAKSRKPRSTADRTLRQPRIKIAVYKVPKTSGGTTHINAIDMVLQTTEDVFHNTCYAGSGAPNTDDESEQDEEMEDAFLRDKQNNVLINDNELISQITGNRFDTSQELPPSKGFDFSEIANNPSYSLSSNPNRPKSRSRLALLPGIIHKELSKASPKHARLLQSAVSDWRSSIRQRLVSLVDVLDTNYGLEKKVRKTKLERDRLRRELLRVRQRKIELAQQIDQARCQFLAKQAQLESGRKIDRFLSILEHGPEDSETYGPESVHSIPVQMERAMRKMEWLQPMLGVEGGVVEKLSNFNQRLADIDKRYGYR